MTIAVTGGGGFIGGHLVRALRHAGIAARVHVGPPGSAPVPAAAAQGACFDIVSDQVSLLRFTEGVETIIHLAGPSSVATSFRDPLSYARIHTEGTAAIAEACAHAGVRRLVYVSSAEVYGQPEMNPVAESAPLAPRSPYAAAKVGAEAFVRSGALMAGYQAVIVRPFLVYGPGMSPTSLVGSLVQQVQQARRGDPLKVADLRPVRDYCFVEDVVAGLIASCRADLPERIRVYNLGSGIGVSVEEVALRIGSMTDRGVTVRSAADADRPRAVDVFELVSDSSRARRELGWHPLTDLASGLARTLQHALQHTRG
jgi:UDP-glucose 4-epimerase